MPASTQMTGGDRPSPLSDPAFRAGLRPIPAGPVGADRRVAAVDLVGVRPTGGPVEVGVRSMGSPVLLCFLHVRCDGCDGFWRGLAGPTAHLPVAAWAVARVAVTRGPSSVDPAEVARVADGISGVPVVMSDQAWVDYQVSGYPFFVLVDPAVGSVIGETVGFGWGDVGSMIEASLSTPG